MLHRWSEGPGVVVPQIQVGVLRFVFKEVLSLMSLGMFLRKRSTYKLAEPLY